MKKYTVEEIIEIGVCYTQEQVEDLFMKTGIKEASVMDILKTDLIPDDDKIYVCSKILPDNLLHTFACDCAERALQQEREHGREPDIRSWEAIRIKRLWINGKTSYEELSTARKAAWSAAWSEAAGSAARAAEGAAGAAWIVAAEAAWSAAWSAEEAAWSAVAEAEKKERKWQAERLIELIERGGE